VRRVARERTSPILDQKSFSCLTWQAEGKPTREKNVRKLLLLMGLSMLGALLFASVALAETLIGDEADNRLVGSNQADYIGGKGGNDTLYGQKRNDELRGNDGDDTLYGGAGNDFLLGGPGDDVIYAGGANDRVHGGTGNDEVYAGAGDDVIYLKDGEVDVGDCGPGTDTAVTFEPIDQPAPGTEPYANCERIATPIEP
jgi:Ca2+-binding RTX toxin-like protein